MMVPMSSFSWLAVDRRQHRQMMELVDRFRDESTVDDLGFVVEPFGDSGSSLVTALR